MHALVTGGTGMIGNAVVRELSARGHQIRALVRDPERARPVLPEGVELAVGDINDPSSLPAACKGADVVFHAAGTPEGWQRRPGAFDRINRQGTVNVLTAAAETGVGRVVYTSTMDVFRPDDHGVLREDQLDPDPKPTPYEQSKQDAMREVERFLRDGLDVVQTNPAATYGPSPFDTGMAEFFVKLLRRRAPMLPPGGCALAYVDAVGRAHVEAAERGRTGEQYLLACGYASLRELAELTLKPLGRRVPPTGPRWLVGALAAISEPIARTFGVRPVVSRSALTFFDWQVRADSSKAQRELGYEPVPISEGVARTVADLRANRGR
jgi:dihydroflavonol-4-reductase